MKIQPPLTRAELELFMGYFERNGPGDHAEDCPEDDTCDCHIRTESDAIGRASVILHHYSDVIAELTALRAERDHWKANHDRVVGINRTLQDRPDLKERATLVQKLIAERDRLREACKAALSHMAAEHPNGHEDLKDILRAALKEKEGT